MNVTQAVHVYLNNHGGEIISGKAVAEYVRNELHAPDMYADSAISKMRKIRDPNNNNKRVVDCIDHKKSLYKYKGFVQPEPVYAAEGNGQMRWV